MAAVLVLDPFGLAEHIEKYNPAQPRAADGKWTKGGAGTGPRLHPMDMTAAHDALTRLSHGASVAHNDRNIQGVMIYHHGDAGQKAAIALTDAAQRWTGSQFGSIKQQAHALLSETVPDHDSGFGADLRTGHRRDAAVLLQTALDGGPVAPELYRGRTISPDRNAESIADFYRYTTVGNEFDYGLVSFDEQRAGAKQFAGSGSDRLMLTIEKGAYGVPVKALSSHSSENEWIVAGRMKVKSHEITTTTEGNRVHKVTLTPLGPPGRGANFTKGDVPEPAGPRAKRIGDYLEATGRNSYTITPAQMKKLDITDADIVAYNQKTGGGFVKVGDEWMTRTRAGRRAEDLAAIAPTKPIVSTGNPKVDAMHSAIGKKNNGTSALADDVYSAYGADLKGNGFVTDVQVKHLGWTDDELWAGGFVKITAPQASGGTTVNWVPTGSVMNLYDGFEAP